MMPLSQCKKFSERFLQIGAFSSGLRRGPALGYRLGCKKCGYFLHGVSGSF